MTTINATKFQNPVIELDPLCIFAKALLLPETKDILMQGSSSGGKFGWLVVLGLTAL